MRRAVIQALLERARADARVVLLTGDIGYGVVEEFAAARPAQFFNAGVAEQNLIAVATGLAASGLRPWVYSIAPFVSARPYEALRGGPVLHGLPVRIIGVGGGFDYGPAGWTHHAFDDIALMRALPGMGVIAPADDAEAVSALAATWDEAGPIYFRLAKDPAPARPETIGHDFGAGDPRRLRAGGDVIFFTTGRLAAVALDAAAELAKSGVQAGVVHVPRLAPAPATALTARLREAAVVITVEDHAISGGLGTIVCEVAAGAGIAGRVIRCGMREPAQPVGSAAALARAWKLDVAGLVATAQAELGGH